MWLTTTLMVCALGADAPTGTQVKLLTTFREEFVEIRCGEEPFSIDFKMGSAAAAAEKPVHTVTWPKGVFWINKYEVPQNLYEAVNGANPSRWKGPRNSVELVSYSDAAKFCAKATELMQAAKLISATQCIRLPSEAEWEYCCRANSTTKYSFGDDEQQLKNYAWFHGNAAGNDPPVGAKKPNPWGLYDLHGYVAEWCADPWHEDYEGAPCDGSIWTKDGNDLRRVIRGGSWKVPAAQCTSSFRRDVPRETRDDAIGFRCVLSETAR